MSFDLTTKQLDLKARARDLAAGIIAKNAAEVDKSEQYPWENVKALKEAGFMGMTIPTELGGPGLNFLDANLVVEEMASYCGPTGRIAVEANIRLFMDLKKMLFRLIKAPRRLEIIRLGNGCVKIKMYEIFL